MKNREENGTRKVGSHAKSNSNSVLFPIYLDLSDLNFELLAEKKKRHKLKDSSP